MSPFQIGITIILGIFAFAALVAIAAAIMNNFFKAKYTKLVAPVAPTVDPLLLKIHDLLSGLDKSVAVNHATVTAKIAALPEPVPGPTPAAIAQAVVAALPQTITAPPVADQPKPVADVPLPKPDAAAPLPPPPVVPLPPVAPVVAVKFVPMPDLTGGPGTSLCRAELAGGIYRTDTKSFTFDRAALAYDRNADGSFVSDVVEAQLTVGLDPAQLAFGRVTEIDASGKFDPNGQGACVPTLEKLRLMIQTPPAGLSVQSLESLVYSARPAADVAAARVALVASLA
jgi:hypothetical protein